MAHLYIARVYHRRDKPKKNAFTYNVFYIRASLVELSGIALRFFSVNRWNILSLFWKDHGPRDGSDWSGWIDREFERRGVVRTPGDRVELITHPRLFGYAFNPISFWLLVDSQDRLRAVLCEVNNTFGDHHNYVLSHEGGGVIMPGDMFRADKRLYVSPFNTMEGWYKFTFRYTREAFAVSILYYRESQLVLTTHLQGRFEPFTDLSVLKVLVLYPCMTLLVVARIHWQAVKLFFKGVPATLSQRPKGATPEK